MRDLAEGGGGREVTELNVSGILFVSLRVKNTSDLVKRRHL